MTLRQFLGLLAVDTELTVSVSRIGLSDFEIVNFFYSVNGALPSEIFEYLEFVVGGFASSGFNEMTLGIFDR